jgi:hypothetical protein
VEARLGHLEVGLYGALGATLTLLLTLVLPAALKLAQGGTPPQLTPWVILGLVTVAAIYLASGAIGAVYLGDPQSAKDAVSYGMASQALLAGVIKTGDAAAGGG